MSACRQLADPAPLVAFILCQGELEQQLLHVLCVELITSNAVASTAENSLAAWQIN